MAESLARPARIAVVDAGVTGLAGAWRLQQAGHGLAVSKALPVPGGPTRSLRQDGFVFDPGAITLLPAYVRMAAQLHELGLVGCCTVQRRLAASRVMGSCTVSA